MRQQIRALVEQNREIIGWGLVALTFAAMAFDHFFGDGFSPRLLELRAIYFAIVSLFVGYLYILSTPQPDSARVKK